MPELRQFTGVELSRLSNKSNLHLLIEGKVYDVHEFVNEHPGGDLVLLGEAGRDATKAWEDVQHSEEAKELMRDYLVGYCTEISSKPDTLAHTMSGKQSTLFTRYLLLFLSVCVALLVGAYLPSWENYLDLEWLSVIR